MDLESFEQQIRTDFLQEAQEMLEETESAFLDLEQNPENKGILDRIFRLAHTVKGSGYAAGFTDLAEFAHVFETLLGKLRSQDMAVSSTVVDVLLQGNDVLRRYVGALTQDGQAHMDTSAVAQKIRGFLEPSSAKAPPQSQQDGDGLHLFDDEPEVVASTPKSPPKPSLGTLHSVLPNIGNGSILLVDDEPQMIDVLAAYLEGFALPVLRATDGSMALDILQKNSIELIITDLKMPRLNGIEFIAKVRERDAKIPVVFMSGAAERADIVQFINLGAFAFLEKPFEEQQLLVTVRNALLMKQMKDTVVRLSGLNFRAYVATLKLGRLGQNQGDRSQVTRQLEEYLDQIATLTNYIVHGPKGGGGLP